ncbi:hypothetical protein N9404_04150 [Candidatus Pelagibacter sp.]|nr:hypothetical protein [Candidatus Pelagibacter sp.]
MADVVLNQTGATALFQGEKKLITHYNNVSDNAGGSTKIVDVSALSVDGNGGTPVTVRLNKIWYSVSVTAKVDSLRLLWDADTDATFITLEGSGFLDFSSIGGIKNNEATNFTGDVLAVLPACSAGDTATITCEWIKVY